MRFLPFVKGKKGFQFAGGGVDTGGGGSGYTLPVASDSTLGGVKIGSGVNVTNDGTISVEGGSGLIYSSTETKVGKYGTVDMYCKKYRMSNPNSSSEVTITITDMTGYYVQGGYANALYDGGTKTGCITGQLSISNMATANMTVTAKFPSSIGSGKTVDFILLYQKVG